MDLSRNVVHMKLEDSQSAGARDRVYSMFCGCEGLFEATDLQMLVKRCEKKSLSVQKFVRQVFSAPT